MKSRTLLFSLIILVSLAILVLYGRSERSAFITVADVDEVVTASHRFSDREIRVRGFVKPGSILRYGDDADFTLVHEGQELQVHFGGGKRLPDTFESGAAARVDGHLRGRKLMAHRVEAKCASRYTAEQQGGDTSENFKGGKSDTTP